MQEIVRSKTKILRLMREARQTYERWNTNLEAVLEVIKKRDEEKKDKEGKK